MDIVELTGAAPTLIDGHVLAAKLFLPRGQSTLALLGVGPATGPMREHLVAVGSRVDIPTFGTLTVTSIDRTVDGWQIRCARAAVGAPVAA